MWPLLYRGVGRVLELHQTRPGINTIPRVPTGQKNQPNTQFWYVTTGLKYHTTLVALAFFLILIYFFKNNLNFFNFKKNWTT